MQLLLRLFLLCVVAISLQACNSLAFTNSKLEQPAKSIESKASFKLIDDRGQWAEASGGKTLFVLALSGGGSRASYWSAAVMFKLQTLFADQGIDLLAEVDAISSISGGSMAAAVYAISADGIDDEQFSTEHGNRPLWEEEKVKKALSKNFMLRWFGNWFWPHNIARYWLTAYDRTDIMAETLADNLFETSNGHDFTVGEINPSRPNLILNATVSSGEAFADSFSYTAQDFADKLCSDVNKYELARAVMGSASFPAAFNSMTLKNHAFSNKGVGCEQGDGDQDEAYLHVIDGGSHDNLGLTAALQFIRMNHDDYDRVVVISIDAYTPPVGVSSEHANPRSLTDYIIDTNFIDSVNSLMDRNRSQILNKMYNYSSEFGANVSPENRKRVEFYHLTFESIADTIRRAPPAQGSLLTAVNQIKTSLSISGNDQLALDEAVEHLISKDNICLQRIAQLISGKLLPAADPDQYFTYCAWPGLE